MTNLYLANRPDGVRRVGTSIIKAAALALILGLTMPAMASNQRSVKMRVTPVYPESAKHMRVAGPVQIDVTVDPNGKVTNMRSASTNPLLAAAAEDAVRQWRFAPASNATKESVVIEFTYNN